MTAPFTDAGLSEVLARVTYRVVEREWRRGGPASGLDGQGFVAQLERELPGEYFGFLRTHFRAALYEMSRGCKLAQWRDAVVLRSRAGKAWRECLLPLYKANRKPTPPVSNTGGQTRYGVQNGRATRLPKVEQRDR